MGHQEYGLSRRAHISLQEVVHARLRNFLGLLELLQGLPQLLIGDLPLALLLVVKI